MSKNKLGVKVLSGAIGIAATVLLLWLVQYGAVQFFFVAVFFGAVAWQFAKLAYELMTGRRSRREKVKAEPVHESSLKRGETPADDLLRKLSGDYTVYSNGMVQHPPTDIFFKADEIATHSNLQHIFRRYLEDRTPEEVSYLNRYPLEVLCGWFAY